MTPEQEKILQKLNDFWQQPVFDIETGENRFARKPLFRCEARPDDTAELVYQSHLYQPDDAGAYECFHGDTLPIFRFSLPKHFEYRSGMPGYDEELTGYAENVLEECLFEVAEKIAEIWNFPCNPAFNQAVWENDRRFSLEEKWNEALCELLALGTDYEFPQFADTDWRLSLDFSEDVYRSESGGILDPLCGEVMLTYTKNGNSITERIDGQDLIDFLETLAHKNALRPNGN